MLEKIISFAITLFYNCLVILQQIWLIIRHRSAYFYSPRWRPLPEFLNSESLGTHKTAHLKSNINLHYVESGDPSKPLMLFLHGFPEFWYSWRHQITAFKDSYRIVAVDMRGYGLSDKPQDVASYKMPLLVNDVKELLDFLGCHECTLVAHDWGGAVAWSFAMRYPEHLSRLVVMNCPHTLAFKKVMRSNFGQFRKSWYMFFFQMPYLPEWVISRFDFQSIDNVFRSKRAGLRLNHMSDDELVAYKAAFNIPGALTAAINYYRASFRYRNEIKLPNKGLINCALPVLLIFGNEDMAISEDAINASYDYCPHMELRSIPGASHWVQQDMPSEVNTTMCDFFDKHSI